MTDRTTPDAAHDWASTPAIVTYLAVALAGLVDLGVFLLIGFHVAVEPAMLTVVGQIQGGTNTMAAGAILYWVGSSSSSKSANAALAQLAGAGAPPPADPVSQEPKPDA